MEWQFSERCIFCPLFWLFNILIKNLSNLPTEAFTKATSHWIWLTFLRGSQYAGFGDAVQTDAFKTASLLTAMTRCFFAVFEILAHVPFFLHLCILCHLSSKIRENTYALPEVLPLSKSFFVTFLSFLLCHTGRRGWRPYLWSCI